MSPWVFIYFVLIVVLGGFFVINLFLAVIFEETLAAQVDEQIFATTKELLATHAPAQAIVGGAPPARPPVTNV